MADADMETQDLATELRNAVTEIQENEETATTA